MKLNIIIDSSMTDALKHCCRTNLIARKNNMSTMFSEVIHFDSVLKKFQTRIICTFLKLKTYENHKLIRSNLT